MNYFAHGRLFVDEPYLLAGTAVPDWLNVSDRGVRVRSRHAEPFLEDGDRRLAALARGVMRHHADDRWFHQTRAFAELSIGLAVRLRELLPADEDFRPSFLGHILVELLLDAELIAEAPQRLEAYYAAIEGLDPECVAAGVNRMAPRRAERLAEWIPRFAAERFLWDYAEDDKLCFRLNQVMRRVKLAPLPPSFAEVLPEARSLVRLRRDELLTVEEAT